VADQLAAARQALAATRAGLAAREGDRTALLLPPQGAEG
jgi:hypothetical protein